MSTTNSLPPAVLPQTSTGWTAAKVDGFEVQALVFAEGSHFGIGFDEDASNWKETGRISKLWIRRISDGVEVFNYDRGLDFHDHEALHPVLLQAIIEVIEGAEFRQVRRLPRYLR